MRQSNAPSKQQASVAAPLPTRTSPRQLNASILTPAPDIVCNLGDTLAADSSSDSSSERAEEPLELVPTQIDTQIDPFGPSSNSSVPNEWQDIDPDVIIEKLKALNEAAFGSNKKALPKSYSKWDKLTADQRNKTVAWFKLLNTETQGHVIAAARSETATAMKEQTAKSQVTTKNDLARLLHLYKEPTAQMHWTNMGRSLIRTELDARHSTSSLSDAANPYRKLAEIFNDYETFQPQHAMLVYENVRGIPVKKSPFKESEPKWKQLAPLCFDIEPHDLSRKEIHRDADWIKTHWQELRRLLHDRFEEHNRSGRRDAIEEGWMTNEDLNDWAQFAPRSKRYPMVMVYSAAILEIGDFNLMGRKLPKGTGIDNSILSDTPVEEPQAKRVRGPYRKKKSQDSGADIGKIIGEASKKDTKLKALEILMNGDNKALKKKAEQALLKYAFSSDSSSSSSSSTESGESDSD